MTRALDALTRSRVTPVDQTYMREQLAQGVKYLEEAIFLLDRAEFLDDDWYDLPDTETVPEPLPLLSLFRSEGPYERGA